MQSQLSAIALGVVLACASQFASAQSVVTLTQQGNGNTAFTEQLPASPSASLNATITQIGDNNHVGGPGGTTDGIRQLNIAGPVFVDVLQKGTGNNAGVTQDKVGGVPTFDRITQLGNTNSATLRLLASSDLYAYIDQAGNGNVINALQVTAGTGELHSIQNGDANRTTVFQRSTAYSGPYIEQNGDGNVASVYMDGAVFGGTGIRQIGTQNSADTVQTDSDESGISIDQLGVGNQASANLHGSASELDDNDRIEIHQNGLGNHAKVIQTGVRNLVTIGQLGNANTALVSQAGQDWVAHVSQIGNGNWTNIYQH